MIKDALESLGTKIDANQERDAVHVAVLPVQAKKRVLPGEHISLDGGEPIGIADPFLAEVVRPGEWYWLMLYPRTITSLRHVWTHPEVDDVEVVKAEGKERAEQWLRDFAAGSDCGGFEDLVSVAMRDPEWMVLPYDASGAIPAEFWDYLEIYTGEKFPVRAEYFSCSC